VPEAAAPAEEGTAAPGPAESTEEEAPAAEEEPAAEAPSAPGGAAAAAPSTPALAPGVPAATGAPTPSPGGGALPAPTEAQAAAAAEELPPQAATGDLVPAEREVALTSLGEDAIPGADVAEGGGGGGGGDGGAAEAEPEAAEPPPDVAQMKPAEALGAVSTLEPVALDNALGGVRSSVSNDIGARREDLATNPPSVERPIGAPISKQELAAAVPPAPALPKKPDATKVAAVAPGADKKTPAPAATPDAPPAAITKLQTPNVGSDQGGTVTAEDAAKAKRAISRMPVSDPGLDQTAGPPPVMALEGNADPARMVEQHDKLRGQLTEARGRGAAEVAAPMGEEALFPKVPAETLRGKVASSGGGGGAKGGAAAKAGGGGKGGGGGGGGGAGDDAAISIIAKEKKGDEIATAVGKAQGDVAGAESDHAAKVSEVATKQTKAIADAEKENAQQQADARHDTEAKVADGRGAWARAQDDTLRKADSDASEKVAGAATAVNDRAAQANEQAAHKVDEGNKQAAQARKQGEEKAEQERDKGDQDSDGFFSWAASAVQALVNQVKAAIQKALEAARRFIKDALDKAKKAAVDLIEKSRQWVVDKLHQAGDLLIGIGNVALAAFPGLRDKFTNLIKGAVAVGEGLVNKLADGLKKGVSALLDAWAAELDMALGLLAKGLELAVEALGAVVKGAIELAKKVADAVGEFVQIIKDVAHNPGAWLRSLGAAIVDGIKRFPKAALAAIKEWFNSKIEGLISIGKTLWNVVTGKLGLGEIVKLAFDAIKAVLPTILVRILIEKLVSLLVPAVAAVMAIVEALQAAWGTVTTLLKNFQLFIAFLKAIKSGSAGPKFAELLAGGVVLLLDFVANFLLAKLGTALKKLAAKLVAIAQRLLKKLAASLKKAVGKIKQKLGIGKPKKAKDKKPPKDEDKTKKEEKKKLRKAMRRLRISLFRGIPEERVRPTVEKIAQKFQVSSIIKPGERSWTLGFHVNPEDTTEGAVSDRGRGVKESAEQAESAKNAAISNVKAQQTALAGAAASPSTTAPAAKPSAQEIGRQANEKGKEFQRDVEGTFRALEATGSTSVVSADDPTVAALLKPGQGGFVVTEPGQDPTLGPGEKGPGGFDTVIVRGDQVIIIESKRSRPEAFKEKSKAKTEKLLAAQDPGAVKQLKRSTLFRVVKKAAELSQAGFAKSIVQAAASGVPFLSAKRRLAVNQVSAVTTNLVANLGRLQGQLGAALAAAKDLPEPARSAERTRIGKALETVTKILNREGGRIQIILATTQEPSDAQLNVIQAMVNESARDLTKVDIAAIKVAIVHGGKIIGGRPR
jgi:hypothetical protein